jgi:hypothetical protein
MHHPFGLWQHSDTVRLPIVIYGQMNLFQHATGIHSSRGPLNEVVNSIMTHVLTGGFTERDAAHSYAVDLHAADTCMSL